ncbi:MAG: GAF domain-containing protein, partial [Gemmatimonadota bacterium]
MASHSREQSELSALADLYEATRAVGLSDTLDDTVDDVLDRAQELIGFEHCALMLHDRSAGELTVERVRGYGDRVDEILGMTIAVGDGISGWAAEQRAAARVGDVRDDPRYIQGLPEARSNLAVPLVVGNEVAGVINVESERTSAFTEEHEMLLTVLGAQAALAILAARARRRLRDRLRHLDALFRISRLASREQGLDETLNRILDITGEITPEGQVAILLLNEDDDLVVRAAQGYRENVTDLTIPLGEGTTGRCAALGETVVVDDVRGDPHYIPGVPGGRSEIAVPLRVEDRVIGVLDAEAAERAAFGEEEERTLSVVAQQVAAVVHTIQLHEQTREMAITDSLTGLHNRRHFIARLEDHLRRAGRYGEELALLLLDCDDLKRINDEHGHYCG